MSHRPEPIERHVFETAQLVRDHPPHWRERNKRVVHEIALPVTAVTAFRSAVLESTHARGAEPPVVVHTGFWGCGAFGGNRVLMTTLQVLAAKMAGVDRIVLHTGDRTGAAAVAEVRRLFDENLSARSPRDVDDVTTRIEAIGFEWGVSDGS